MQLNTLPMYANVGDMTAGRHDSLADAEGGRNSDSFNSDVNAPAIREAHDFFGSFSAAAVHNFCCPQSFRNFQTVIIQIDHDNISRRVKLSRQESRKTYGSSSHNRYSIAWFDLAIKDAAFEPCRQNVAQHCQRFLIGASRNVIEACICERDPYIFRLG